jgi:ubiquinone/menaquinone biosynthesis C-methylase UbiE
MNMVEDVWESRYLDAYDKVLLNSEIYLAVRDFHVNAMKGRRIVLDSGCGTGNVTVELLKRGHTVHAIDTSRKALDILGKKCLKHSQRLRVYNMSAERLPFEDNTFDGVTSMFVAHFVGDFEGYLKEHYRVLKPNGVFAFTGRTSGENIELVAESYENSLRKKGLLPKLEKEMEIMREDLLGKVSKIVKHPYTAEETKKVLQRIGFKEIHEFPNPYFGQCYSLLARK